MLRPNEIRLIEAFKATGRVALVRPKVRRISLNGGAFVTVEDALQRIREFIRKEKENS